MRLNAQEVDRAYAAVAKINLSHLSGDAEAVCEYKKFMALASVHAREIAMMSTDVDAVWHAHLAVPDDYADFCDVLGAPIDHVPNRDSDETEMTERVNKFIHLYHSYFGELSKVWGQGRQALCVPTIREN